MGKKSFKRTSRNQKIVSGIFVAFEYPAIKKKFIENVNVIKKETYSVQSAGVKAGRYVTYITNYLIDYRTY